MVTEQSLTTTPLSQRIQAVLETSAGWLSISEITTQLGGEPDYPSLYTTLGSITGGESPTAEYRVAPDEKTGTPTKQYKAITT